jgi:hypothetical protein
MRFGPAFGEIILKSIMPIATSGQFSDCNQPSEFLLSLAAHQQASEAAQALP